MCSVVSNFFSKDITSCTFEKMLSDLADAAFSEKTSKTLKSLLDSVINPMPFWSDYNKGGLTKTDMACSLNE